MGRFLLLAAALAGLIWLLRRATADREGRPPDAEGSADALVRCAHCGVHVPRQDAHHQDDRTYCSADHAQRGPGADPR